MCHRMRSDPVLKKRTIAENALKGAIFLHLGRVHYFLDWMCMYRDITSVKVHIRILSVENILLTSKLQPRSQKGEVSSEDKMWEGRILDGIYR